MNTTDARGARRSVVAASDGAALAVREFGSPSPTVTVVFCHGLGLDSRVWTAQIGALAGVWADAVRLVSYDQRGHGLSSADGACTIEQLGDDLAAVVDTVAPTGKVLLVGHSLGGMTILAFAARHPHLLDRIAGVVFVATAAHRIASSGLPRLLATPAVPILQTLAGLAPAVVERSWVASRNLLAPLIGCTADSSGIAAVAAVAGGMIHRTPIMTLLSLLAAVRRFDGRIGLLRLAETPAVVVCGRHDVILPPIHSHRICAALLRGRLVVLDDARHMVGLEQPRAVTTAIESLLHATVDTTHSPKHFQPAHATA